MTPATRRQSGKKNEFRSFKANWYESFPWLSVCLSIGKVFCHICRTCNTQGLTKLGKNAENAFIVDGFGNWKKAVQKFQEHMESDSHRSCIEQQNCLKQKPVNVQLEDKLEEHQRENYDMLLKQLSSIKMLLRQGLALRGHDDGEGNLIQTLLLRSEDVPGLKKWIECKRYTSPEIVNEQVTIMGQEVLRKLLLKIHEAKYYAILADEARDISNMEQLTMCIRWVDKRYEVHEDCIGLIQVPNITSAILTAAIKDTLIRCNLPLTLCRGQGYDGAANMSGHIRGVATMLLKEEPAALHVHCLAHCLNLCLQDVGRKLQVVRNALDICIEVGKLILWSPKRMHAFRNSQRDFSPQATNIRPLCPTRWTVRQGALSSILDNYEALQDTMTTVNQECHDDYGMRAGGILAQLEKFDTLFGLSLSELVFGATEQVSRTLQGKNTSIMEALQATDLAQKHLKRLRSDEMFNRFYNNVETKSNGLTSAPSLPRYRRAPKRLDDGSLPHRYETPKEFCRQTYFELLDMVHVEMDRRFAQSSLKVPRALEKLLVGACNGEITTTLPELVETTYAKDVDIKKLLRQLQMLPDLVNAAKARPLHSPLQAVTNVCTLAAILDDVPMAPVMFSEVDKMVRLFLTVPVTTATGERSFSTLRRIKTYLRSTMSQKRLNNTLLLNIHKEETDNLVVADVARLFISYNERRQRFFGPLK